MCGPRRQNKALSLCVCVHLISMWACVWPESVICVLEVQGYIRNEQKRPSHWGREDGLERCVQVSLTVCMCVCVCVHACVPVCAGTTRRDRCCFTSAGLALLGLTSRRRILSFYHTWAIPAWRCLLNQRRTCPNHPYKVANPLIQ